MAFERRIVTTYDASTAGFDRGTRRVESQLARLQRTTDQRLAQIDQRFERAGRAALRLGTALRTVLGIAGAGAGAAAVRNYAETWRQVERSLTAAGFAIEGNREKLAQLAIRVRGDFADTSQAVSRFARTTGDDIETAIRRVETLRKLFSVGGLSTAEASSTTLQTLQAIQSGVLQGDEFRTLREAAPVELLNELARIAGVTRGELKQLAADGELTSDVLIKAIDNLARTADEQFSQLAISGSEAVEVLQTGFSTFFGRVDEELGATAGVNEFLVDLGTLLADDAEAAQTFTKSLEVAALAATSLAGGRGLGALNNVLREGSRLRKEAVADARAAVIAAQAEVQANIRRVEAARLNAIQTRANTTSAAALEKANTRLTVAMTALSASETRAAAAANALTIAQGRLSAATRVTTAAVSALRGILAFFGGVPGLITAAALSVVFFSDSLFGARDAAQSAQDSANALNSAVDDLKTVQEAYSNAIAATAKTQNQASASIVADTKREFEAKRALLELEIKRQQAAQALRRAELNSVEARLAAVPSSDEVRRNALRGGVPGAENLSEEDRRRVIDAEIDRARRVAEIRDEIKGLAAEADLAEIAIERAIEAVNTAFNDTGGGSGDVSVPSGGGGSRARRETRNRDAEEQARELERLAEARADILASGQEYINAQEIEARALSLSREAAQRLRFEFDLLSDAQRAGIEVTPELAEEFSKLAGEMAAAQARTDEFAERMDFAEDATGGFFADLVDGLRNGENVFKTFANAANRALDLVIDKLLNDLLSAIFKVNDAAAGGSNGGGLLGGLTSIVTGAIGLFGGGGGFVDVTGPGGVGGLYHTGGVAGRGARPQKWLPQGVWDAAPRYHNGGIAGLLPNEVPAILQRGEVVVPNNIGRSGGGMAVDASMVINIDRPGASIEEISRQLEPRLQRHREETIQSIRRENERDPAFLAR